MHINKIVVIPCDIKRFCTVFLLTVPVMYGVVPRFSGLKAEITVDEQGWMVRSASFIQNVTNGNYEHTIYAKIDPNSKYASQGLITRFVVGLSYYSDYAHNNKDPLLVLTKDALYHGRLALSITSLVLTGIAIFLLYILHRSYLFALLASLMLITDPVIINNARVIHLDAVVSLLITISLILLALTIYNQKPYMPLFAGIFACMASLQKTPGLLLLPYILGFLLLQYIKTKKTNFYYPHNNLLGLLRTDWFNHPSSLIKGLI